MDGWLEFMDVEAKKNIASMEKIENLIRVPLVHQEKSHICGLAALQSVLAYYGKEFRQDELEKILKPDKDKGTDHRKIIEFTSGQGLAAKLETSMLLSDLWNYIDDSIPVIVLLQAWTEDNRKVTESWKDGHYAVAVGYDDNNAYFMDPSTLGHYTLISIPEFVSRWHDISYEKRLIHAGIIIRGKRVYDSDKIVKMQ